MTHHLSINEKLGAMEMVKKKNYIGNRSFSHACHYDIPVKSLLSCLTALIPLLQAYRREEI